MIAGRLTLALLASLALAGAALVVARSNAPPAPPPQVELAQDSCSANCNAQWNRCRLSTKGSASCDAQRAACMQACLPRKR